VRSRIIGAAVVAAVGAGCGGSAPQPDGQTSQAAPPPESEAPVALNPDVPIAYPPALFEQKIEGDVTLRLFVDSTGRLLPESTRVAESSGYPALDSAALAGSPGLRFAPAKRHGIAVATAFLQPVEFRQVGTTRTGAVSPPPAAPPAAPAVAPVRAAPRPRPPAARPRPDTARATPDTTRTRVDSGAPPPAPAPVPPAPPPAPETGGPAH
jgi:TonB family protein